MDLGLGSSNGSTSDVGSKKVDFKEVGKKETEPIVEPKPKVLLVIVNGQFI